MMSDRPWHRLVLTVALLLFGVLGAGSASAQDTDPWRARLEARGADVVAVMQGTKARDEVFTPAFNEQVTEQMLATMMRQMETQLGPLEGIESIAPGTQPGSATITLRFAQATASGPMQLEPDEPYRVSGLLLNTIQPLTDGETPILEQVRALPGEASMLLTRLDGSAPLLAHNADAELAIGSTFKLYVLFTLVQEIAAGKRSWDDVVPLAQHSFPSGVLQEWPLGTPLTLQSLATLMISISDNTATDQLIATLGREAVEAEMVASGHSAPERNQPFMTTREVFELKAAGDAANLSEYAAFDRPARLAVLEALPQRETTLAEVTAAFASGPRAIDVEWFASGHDIARVFDRVKDDPVALGILAINTALDETDTAGWDYVGYKGGSEPGVLNTSWLLRDGHGDAGAAWYVLTLGWNNPDEDVPVARLLGLARSALATSR